MIAMMAKIEATETKMENEAELGIALKPGNAPEIEMIKTRRSAPADRAAFLVADMAAKMAT